MANWKFILANTLDNSNIIELSQARDRQIQVGLNKSGSLKCTLPLNNFIAPQVQTISTCIKAVQDGVIRWSGPVWTTEDSPSDNKLTINCVGWFELLNQRMTRIEILDYIGWDIGNIAHDLLDIANHQVFANVPVTPVIITKGNWSPTVTTDYSPLSIYTNIGQQITTMSNLENGYDFDIDPATRKLNIYTKKGTTVNSVFGYGWGPDNLSNVVIQTDGSQVLNDMVVTAQGGTTPGEVADPGSISQYGPFQQWVGLTAIPGDNTALNFAGAEVAVRAQPRVTFTLTPKTKGSGNPSIPAPFVDYNPGDISRLSVKYGPRLSIDKQKIRIFGFTVDIDNNNNEKVSGIQTTYSS